MTIKWLHQLFNPHCQHCADERREQRDYLREQSICASCETLERENARLVRDNERLITLLLDKPATTDKVQDVRDLKPISTTRTPFIPSAVRRQLLEQESRNAAQIAKDAPKPDTNKLNVDKDTELKELEAELDDVRKTRESTTRAS